MYVMPRLSGNVKRKKGCWMVVEGTYGGGKDSSMVVLALYVGLSYFVEDGVDAGEGAAVVLSM